MQPGRHGRQSATVAPRTIVIVLGKQIIQQRHLLRRLHFPVEEQRMRGLRAAKHNSWRTSRDVISFSFTGEPFVGY